MLQGEQNKCQCHWCTSQPYLPSSAPSQAVTCELSCQVNLSSALSLAWFGRRTSSQSCQLFPILPLAMYCGWVSDLNCRLVSRSGSSLKWTLDLIHHLAFSRAASRLCYQDFWSACSLCLQWDCTRDGEDTACAVLTCDSWLISPCGAAPTHAAPWQYIFFALGSFSHQEERSFSWAAVLVTQQNFSVFAFSLKLQRDYFLLFHSFRLDLWR